MSKRISKAGSIGCFLILLFISLTEVASAGPVFGKKYNLLQPDETIVAVKIWGDEFYQVVESMEGYTLVRDLQTQQICYAELSKDKNELRSTGISASSAPSKQIKAKKHLRINKSSAHAKIKKARKRFADGKIETAAAQADNAPMLAPNISNIKGICLIVDFPDEAGTIPPEDVDDFCNQVGYTGYGNNGSIRDYFYDVSDGNLTYTNYVTPTYYTALYDKGYYDNPAEFAGPKARELIIEALNWLDASGFDFSQYDADNDGYIDGINCFYAGTVGSGWAMGLWPHSWTVSFSADGVSAYKYQITDMGANLEMGTFCHENGHMICWWPDLYDYGYESEGTGYYCLMAAGSFGGGGKNPHEPCAYLKAEAGWADVTNLSTPQANLFVTAGENSFYKFEHPTKSNEFYMVSNRQKTARDSSLPDAGIAIWHIDTNGSNDNEQMTCNKHYLVTLVQADGKWDLENGNNYGDSTDLYDAASYNKCSSFTYPNTDWWCDGPSELNINSISPSGHTMFFNYGLVSSPPIAMDAKVNTTIGDSVTINLVAVDEGLPDPPGTLTYIITSLPENGALKDSDNILITNVPYHLPSKKIVYVPDAAFSGADSFQFKVNDDGTPPDGGDSNIATVSIDVFKVIYRADMETDPGWDLDPGTGNSRWQWGTPLGGGGQSHGNPDPSSGYTGSNVIGYNLSGDYGSDIVSEWATTPAINCSNYENVHLYFYRWLNVEQPIYDNAYVEVSNDGSAWTTIWENPEEITDSSWSLQTFDISETADGMSTVYIRWGLSTDYTWEYSGWNIDDVSLAGNSTAPAFDYHFEITRLRYGDGPEDPNGWCSIVVWPPSGKALTEVTLTLPDMSELTEAVSVGVDEEVHFDEEDIFGYYPVLLTDIESYSPIGQYTIDITCSDASTYSLSFERQAGEYPAFPEVLYPIDGQSCVELTPTITCAGTHLDWLEIDILNTDEEVFFEIFEDANSVTVPEGILSDNNQYLLSVDRNEWGTYLGSATLVQFETMTISTIGNTTVFAMTSTVANRRAMPYTMTEDGTLKSITMYHEAGSGGNMILAVYDDNGGPDVLIGDTDPTPVSSSAGWQTIDLTVPVEVYFGETIWLAWVYENNPGIRYKVDTPGRVDAGKGWSDGMPDPFGGGSQANYIYSIYATYCPGYVPPPCPSVGNTTVFAMTSTVANRRAMPYTMPENGIIESITMYHEAGTGGNMILAVYDDNGGPDVLIGDTLPTAASPSAGWQTIDLNVPVDAYSGETIWLAWVYQNNPGIRYEVGSPGRVDAGVGWPGMPNPFGDGSQANYIYSIYATYCADGGCTAEVPDVTGMDKATAIATINAVEGLSAGTPTYDCSDTVAVGDVMDQNPGTGTVSCGTVVDLVVSTGPCCESPGTIGNTKVFDQISISSNRRAMPYTMPEDGTIESITMYHEGGSGNVLLAVYDDGAGLPENLLSETNETPINASAGWQTIDLSVPVDVYSGETIWLAWVYQNNPGIRYEVGSPGRVDAGVGWPGMPDPFGPSTKANYIYSIYATYCTVPPCTVDVPDVTGMDEAAAIAAINAVENLSAGTPPTYDCSDTVAVGDVISQNPGPGTVSCGTVVELVVSTGSCCQTPETVGNTKVFDQISISSNRRAMPYTMPEDGTIESITMYHEAGSGGNMILAVYDDNGGPDALLGETDSTLVSPSAGWQTIDLNVPVDAYSGETIWLAWVYQNNPGIRYEVGSPGRVDAGKGWSDGMPDPFGSGTQADYIYSIYATYCLY